MWKRVVAAKVGSRQEDLNMNRSSRKALMRDEVFKSRRSRDVIRVKQALGKLPPLHPASVLPISSFRMWFDALKTDNVTLVEDVLEQCDEAQRDLLIHGAFNYEYDSALEGPECERSTLLSFRRCFVLAAAFGSQKVFRVFLFYMCRVEELDVAGNNVIHGLVLAAGSRPDGCRQHVRIYQMLMSVSDLELRRQMLMTTNDAGLRPLELAGKVGVSSMLICILNEPDVYRLTRHTEGLYNVFDYDITDYEGFGQFGARMNMSPLQQLVSLTIERADREDTRLMFDSIMIKHWMKYKFYINAPFLLFWFIQRVVFCACVFLINSTYGMKLDNSRPIPVQIDANLTNKQCFPDAVGFGLTDEVFRPLGSVVAAYAAIIVLFDVIELIYMIFMRKKSYTELMGVDQEYVVHTLFYRSVNFFVAFALIFRTAYFFLVGGDDVTNFISVLYVLMNTLTVWLLLFFLELAPLIGTFVITIERMILTMANFSCILILLYFGFAQSFYQLLAAKGYCTESFKDLPRSLYSGFRVLLNMFDFFEFPELMDSVSLQVLHVLFILIIPIMLFNYLIALMSEVVSGVHTHKEICITLQRLSASLTVERRLSLVLAPVYRALKSKYFIMDREKVFLRCRVIERPSILTREIETEASLEDREILEHRKQQRKNSVPVL